VNLTYPWSRIKIKSCPMCRLGQGKLEPAGRVLVKDDDGDEHPHLKMCCGSCGYTLLFDLQIAQTIPFMGNDNETESNPYIV